MGKKNKNKKKVFSFQRSYPWDKILLVIFMLLLVIFISLAVQRSVLVYQSRAQLQQGDVDPNSSTLPPVTVSPSPENCKKDKLIRCQQIKGGCEKCQIQLEDCRIIEQIVCDSCGGWIKTH